ncbi:UDP-glycosyltransferase 1 [Cicer arietinum]|uniref:Glycosyltransferase n=1 Tax=Cicer arietinum TaxID=3827 RepID=A0A067XTV7_CICAR|nr:UDP-glycosyltransferase 1 [Cicer arietinum]AGU14067.1 UDP-glycosyltransferase [Cicer arietinum]
MKDTIVLYPAVGSGHLMSMVELGKLILTHHPSFSIQILILNPPNQNITTNNNNDSTTQYTTSISSKFPSINFQFIPSISLTLTLPLHLHTLELSPHCNHHVHHILQSISKTTNLKGVILDFFNYSASQVINTLQIPIYFYFTSSASMLSFFLHFPTFHKNATKPIKDFDIHTPIELPGLPRLFVDDWPEEAVDPTSPSYQMLLECAKSMRESDGIFVNSFDAIERKVIKAMRDGLCVPDGTTPLIFCIGPVISALYEKDENRCMRWLDSQPSQSVVLLSFGSMGRFSKAQLNEIAIGLEKSKQRFLWIVRTKLDLEELSLDELLPKGFLERTKENGMVVRNWAPQRAILSHDSVGGFVTHCGWNSILEAICEGVPMITWPLYAEQKLNRLILVQEGKIALKLNQSTNRFVSGTELGERVMELMESNKGKEIRDNILKMKISAKKARMEGGSSVVDLKRFGDSKGEYDSWNNYHQIPLPF